MKHVTASKMFLYDKKVLWSFDHMMIIWSHTIIWWYAALFDFMFLPWEAKLRLPALGKWGPLKREKDQNNHDIQNCFFFQTLVVFRTGYWPMVKERKIWPTAFQRAICFQIEKIGFTNLKEEKMTLTTCRFPNQEQSCTPRLNWDTCDFFAN